MTLIDRFTSWAPGILGITRILTGVMFACHGAQKVFGAFGGIPAEAKGTWQVQIAGPLELIGGTLIALGLVTRISAFICSGLMAVAYFYGHSRGGFFPKVNGGEPAVMYCWIFLYIAAQGPGWFAIDNWFRRKQGT